MFDWLRRIIYIGDVGRWHARQNYPREQDFIEILLYPAEAGEAAEASTSAAQANERATQAPANDPDEPAREIEA